MNSASMQVALYVLVMLLIWNIFGTKAGSKIYFKKLLQRIYYATVQNLIVL